MERNTYGYFSPVGSNHELEDVSIHSRTPLHYYNAAPVNNPITRTPSPYEPYYRPHTRKYHTPSYYAGYLWNKVILLNFKIRLPKRAFGMKVGKKHWNIGLLVGLYASLAVLITNIALLVYSIVRHLGYDGGVSTIFIGDAGAATRTSTALHVAINALSTVLLTASNYAMQLLCAPTRKELDRAHRSGKWLEIGLMSIYNLRHIDKSRAILWILLATSSLPLHLFYNSAVLSTVSGQDYAVRAVVGNDFGNDFWKEKATEPDAWKRLENNEWQPIYSEQFVSGDFGDLVLMVDKASSTLKISEDFKFSIEAPAASNNSCRWREFDRMLSIRIPDEFPLDSGQLGLDNITIAEEDNRIIFDVDSVDDPRLLLPWPRIDQVNVSDSKLGNVLRMCTGDIPKTRAPDSGWIAHPSNALLHVEYAYSKVRRATSKVQVAVPFLGVVIFMNVIKIICIYFTLRKCSSPHIITVGDAISTYLQSPESVAECKITPETQFSKAFGHLWLGRWALGKKRAVNLVGSRKGWTYTYLALAFLVTFASMALGFAKSDGERGWGTSSNAIIQSTKASFDAKGAVLVAWLANVPQVLLSLTYFTINRVCTSVAFAKEWNDYATHRKGLRVTEPEGDQRSTYFLQLPYRWAFPLTAFSGGLHWLLSQSLFIVRRESMARDGRVRPESTCACGYSAYSLAAFFAAFTVLMVWILLLLREKLPVKIPPAGNCSVLISAACHPPSNDFDGHLKPVQWGVVREGTESNYGHCTFTSQEVTAPKKGCLYSWQE